MLSAEGDCGFGFSSHISVVTCVHDRPSSCQSQAFSPLGNMARIQKLVPSGYTVAVQTIDCITKHEMVRAICRGPCYSCVH